MSQIGILYEAYCTEQKNAPITNEEQRLFEILSSMLAHKEYMEIEELINTSYSEQNKEFFIAGFRAATRMWVEAIE